MTELFALLVGAILGCVSAIIFLRREYVGDLRVDNSDPDGTYLFLELSRPVDFVSRKKYVLLKVNPKSYIPRD